MAYSNQPYGGGKILQSDNTVIDLVEFLESGQVVASTVATPSEVPTSTEGIVRSYDNFSPVAYKVITKDNEIIDLIEFLMSGQLKVSVSGEIVAHGDIDTNGYSIIDSVDDIVTVDADIFKVRNKIASISGGVIDFSSSVQFSAATAATFNGAHTYFPHEIVLSSVASVIRATNGNQVHIVSDDIDTPIDLVGNYVAVQSAICRRVSNGVYQTGNNVTFGNQIQTYNISGSAIFDISASGFRIGSGSRVTEISNSPTAMLSTQLMDAEAIQIAIANYSTSVKSFRGGYDASSNLFPTTGGTGVGGLPKAGDVWVITTGGTLGGTTVSHGDTLIALIDTPGQTASNWSINVNGVALWNGRGGVVFPEDDDYSYDQIEGLPDTAPLGKIMRGNGTEWTETTAQYPDTAGTSGNVLTSDGTNFVSTTLSGGSFGTLWQNSGNYTGMSFSFTTSYQALTGATSWTLATPNVDFTAAVDGQLKYTGAATKTFLVSAYFTVLTSGAGFSIALYVNGSLVSGSESQSPTGYACVIQNFPITLNQNDYISLYGKRAAAASNAIIQMSLSARSV